MELLKQWDNGSRLYTDYSHHAPAIAGNIQAIKNKFPDHKLVVIFQPHQAQRVLAGRDDFAHALQGTDEVIIYKLYTAREDFIELQQSYPQLAQLENFDELGEQFAQQVHGSYHTDSVLWEDISHTPTTPSIIVLFSAGDADAKIRLLL